MVSPPPPALPLIQPLQIGKLIIPFPFLLAPLAGYTHLPFRLLCRRFHCGLAFTEMVTAEGITRRHQRTLNYLETCPEERPVAAHIYGSRAESLAEAARIITDTGRFDLIDINCGCAVRKITRKGAGVALMSDPVKLENLVRLVSRATNLPVTIKTRLGLTPDSPGISAVARAAEEGGAAALFLHGRFASDLHRGPADWEAIQRIKEERSIPVIGNGGITRPEEALLRLQQTGVGGVMIGRAALGHPWIFQDIHCLLRGIPCPPPSPEEIREIIGWHLNELYRLSRRTSEPEAVVCRRFLSHLSRYLSGYPGWRRERRQANEFTDREKLLRAVDRVLEDNSFAKSPFRIK